jgi:hypothetical protein
MKKKYGLVDKRHWKRGIWDTEPDQLKWNDPETGLGCEIHRDKHFGFLRGFVYSPVDIRPKSGDKQDLSLEVYTSHTFVLARNNTYIIGFDCFMPSDPMPATPWTLANRNGYKDMDYVIDQCANLAKQIKKKHIK